MTCSADGLEQITQCPAGCAEGRCCKDGDGDQHSVCAGDCNDADPKVFPGQTEFRDTASAGSFDFNCDQREEQEHPDVAAPCAFSNGSCTGSGWEGAVPKCGDEGTYVQCNPRTGSCTQKSGRQRQACR